jgi:hypothetical protein
MSSELERLNPSEARQALDRRYAQPPWLSAAGQEDRKAENDHAVAMRDVGRRMELQAARAYEALADELVRLDCETRLLDEVMWTLLRIQRSVAAMADGDPELTAKGAILADDFFQRRRHELLDGLDSQPNPFG